MASENLTGQQSHADKIRAAHYRWVGHIPGMTQDEADTFMARLVAGSTIGKLTTGKFGPGLVSYDRFKKHCELHPEWGAEVRKVSKANFIANAKKVNPKKLATQEFCLKGLHAMTPDNVRVWISSGRRQCRACQAVTQANPPVHAVVASLDKIKADLSRGVS